MKHTIQTIFCLIVLCLGATSEAWADVETLTHQESGLTIYVEKIPQNGGTVAISSVSAVTDNKRTVSLTVTPNTGFSVSANLITAEPIVVLPSQAPRRAPGLMEPLVVTGSGTSYAFDLPTDYQAAFVTVRFYDGTETGITDLDQITDPAGHYELVTDVDASSFSGIANFTGSLDGNFHKITNLSKPLFTTLNGGTVKNITFEGVSIGTGDGDGDAGAVCSKATGASRIYNCGILPTTIERDDKGNITGFSGSSVSGSGNVGGLVGTLSETARVINCYSYATIKGGSGSNVGGIVGYNSVASSQTDVATMVMNCMFYGDITDGSTVSPVYGGENIDNVKMVIEGENNVNRGLATYNYYAYSQLKTSAITAGKYNCALAMEERFLNRCEIYRQLLNSNKKLAAIYATGSAANADQMAKWVLETADRQISDPMPYPVLRKREKNKKYPSIINYDATNAPDSASVGRLNGGKLGKTLSVTISETKTNGGQTWPTDASITKGSLTLPRTDKDTTRYNFNYDKVQLPYYNDVGEGNYTGNRVVTGWKIVSVSGGTGGSFSETDAWGGYNFADRKCTNKDVYSVSGRVFSQGAYFDVPYGVTGITIEPYWGVAAYVSDQYYDVVYKYVADNKDYGGQNVNVNTAGLGTQNTNNNDIDIYGDGKKQKVFTSINNARNSMSIPSDGSKTVYDYAVVLVGNVHQAGPLYGNGNNQTNTPYTIMSVDLDKDNEPDYSFIFSHHNRQAVTPIRFDFINVPGTAQAQKPNGTTQLLNVSIFNPRGWFEVTNTCSIFITQFEADNGNMSYSKKTAAPVILLGGVIDQYTSTKDTEIEKSDYNNRTQYIHLGSNACFKDFGNGTHSDGWYATRHVPVSVTGGDFDGFYLSGVYRPDAQIMDDDAEGYISGGRFKEVAGAAQQMINGNVRFQIYNADITNFYGGGINAEKPITGNVTVDIFNSHVDTYCGGPKFGDMQKGGTTFTTKYSNNKAGTSTGTKEITIAEDGIVTTTATGCTFGKFFGAGYGGASSYKLKYYDQTDKDFTTTSGFTSLIANYNNDRGKYYDGQNNQYKTNYGNKGPGVATDFDYEFFVWSSGIVGARFYVYYTTFSMAKTNNVYSYLTKCTVNENFYGGGSLGVVNGTATSELTDCNVKGSVYGGGYSASIPSVPVRATGFAQIPIFNANSGIFETGKKNGTDNFKWKNATLPGGGANALVNGEIPTDVNLDNLGAVTGNVSLTIDGKTVADENGVMMKVSGSVYGGGEESNVEGNTEVNISGGTITQNVFGGGMGVADNFKCDKAMVGKEESDNACEDPGSDTNKVKGTKVSISNGTVNGNVYGGGEVGRVEWNTQVEIGVGTGDGPFAPEINGSVYGAGKGKETHGYAALVRGNSSVTIQGKAKVRDNVYGGGEQATVGRYWVKGIPTTLCSDEGTVVPTPPDGLPDEMPYKTRRGGKCTVIVQGEAQIGPNNGPTETAGHVYGAGKGVTPHYVYNTGNKTSWSRRMVDYDKDKHTGEPGTTWDYSEDYTEAQKTDNNYKKYVWEYFTNEDKYFEFLQTLALATGTDVTINGSAKVKGSVYGGSESGYVQDDTDVKVKGGTIGTKDYGGAYYGNVYGGGKGDAKHMGVEKKYVAAGLVKGNTKVKIENGTILHNIYGGGAYGSVGEFTYDANGMPTGRKTYTVGETVESTTGGNTEITITGGTIGSDGHENGMVFGSSRGDVAAPGTDGVDPNDRMAWVYSTHVKIGDTNVQSSPTIKGSIYGSGENGHTFQNTIVDINKGIIGITDTSVDGGATYAYRGNVYGGGCGTDKYDSDGDKTADTYNPLAGIVQGTTTVNITGGHVVHNVYGAGAMGSVGGGTTTDAGKTTINVTGGRIGYDGNENGHVFGAARGEFGVGDAASNLANVRETEVNINYATTPAADNEGKTEQLIAGSVFGGGEAGTVKGSVAVKMTGGLILNDVYGGGALADTQTSNWDATNNTWANTTSKSALNTTAVRLTGGTILGEAYGGGLGEAASTNYTNGRPAYVWGDVLVDLNNNNNGGDVDDTAKGCAVGQIFGCNNINGTPKGDVMVHVYATQNAKKDNIATKFMKTNVDLGDMTNINSIKASISSLNAATPEEKTDAEKDFDAKYAIYTDENSTDAQKQTVLANMKSIILLAIAEELGISTTEYTDASTDAEKQTALENIQKSINANANRYDVQAVYGGGNMAAYEPVNALSADETTKASATTNVIIDGCGLTSIQNVYGGGNAASTPATNLTINGTYEIDEVFGGGNGKDDIVVNNETKPNPGANVGFYDYSADETTYNTKDKRQLDAFTSKYVYGTGKASVNIYGGTIHRVFGGSNMKGNVRQTAVTMLEEAGGCDFCVDEAYGGGKSAPMDAEAKLLMACIPGLDAAYGGAEAADIMGDVTLSITNGTFDRVFGGNNLSGTISGSIKVNIDEVGCRPIIIGELYGGGNQAPYSVFGYKKNGTNIEPRKNKDDGTPISTPVNPYSTTQFFADPEVNANSFTSIGKIYGGGYGSGATMVGSPTVNVNVAEGRHYQANDAVVPENYETPNGHYPVPSHASGKIGAINDVFGGGNAAQVIGNTNVNIGTEIGVEEWKEVSFKAGEDLPSGVNIRSGTEGNYTYTEVTGEAQANVTYYMKFTVKGVDIRGNVYGGGNNADVTGNTNVQIGKKM